MGRIGAELSDVEEPTDDRGKWPGPVKCRRWRRAGPAVRREGRRLLPHRAQEGASGYHCGRCGVLAGDYPAQAGVAVPSTARAGGGRPFPFVCWRDAMPCWSGWVTLSGQAVLFGVGDAVQEV